MTQDRMYLRGDDDPQSSLADRLGMPRRRDYLLAALTGRARAAEQLAQDGQRDARRELTAVQTQLTAAMAEIARLGAVDKQRAEDLRKAQAENISLRAANRRLVELADERPAAPPLAPAAGATDAYWKAKWEADRRNVTAMHEELLAMRARRDRRATR